MENKYIEGMIVNILNYYKEYHQSDNTSSEEVAKEILEDVKDDFRKYDF